MKKFTVALYGDLHIGSPGEYDAANVSIPDADLALVLGDLVESGKDIEYENALKWIDKLECPAAFVRGNHDNGDWRHYVPERCLSEAREQLAKHKPQNRIGAVTWEPIIWVPSEKTAIYYPKETKSWDKFPGRVQDEIVKFRNLTPAYYAFNAGEMRFICLDTSNWLLGDKQIFWLRSELASTSGPVVIVAHHHFLPVDIQYDTAQIHEREELRKIILEHPNIVAYLNGHAHKDCWWKYGNTDVITTTCRASRTITFHDGRIASSMLGLQPDFSRRFKPDYLCTQTMNPGKFRIIFDSGFETPWEDVADAALGWIFDNKEAGQLSWTMTLPEDLSNEPHQLIFQLKNSDMCRLEVSAPGLDTPVIREVPGADEPQKLTIDIGSLKKGLVKATLECGPGWGYVASTALLNKK